MSVQRVLYFSRIDLPSRKANSIQTMNTCYELACQGLEVVLVVGRLLRSRRDCFAYYGLPDQPRLRFLSLALPIETEFQDWQGTHFRHYLASLLRRFRKRPTVILTRDPAGLELLQMAHRLRPHPGLLTLFEIHKISYLTKASHQQERGRSLDDEHVRAKIEKRRALETEVYANVDGLLCVSGNIERILGEHFDVRAPVCVVPNGTRIPTSKNGSSALPAKLDDGNRDLEIVYAGQLYRWKGVDGLIRAMPHLPGRRLTIVGGNDPADLERLTGLARETGVEGRVDFVGHVPPGEVAAYLRRARVGVVPLPQKGSVEAESFTSPLKIFEFMREGVPIVASDLPSIRELVTHEKHAWLVPPDSPQALAQGLETVLGDRRLATELVRCAAERVLEYTWEARATKILQFIESLQPTVQASRT